MTSPLDAMILKSVRCTKCGAGYGQCNCWTKCRVCGWSFETGKTCRNCKGDGKLEIMASAALEAENRKFPKELRRVPESNWPSFRPRGIKEVWRSQSFLVQVFEEKNGIERISVCRTEVKNADWVDGLSWDELQRLKRECGRGEKDAVEVFPADTDIVNVANMRHLWVLPAGVDFKWKSHTAG